MTGNGLKTMKEQIKNGQDFKPQKMSWVWDSLETLIPTFYRFYLMGFSLGFKSRYANRHVQKVNIF